MIAIGLILVGLSANLAPLLIRNGLAAGRFVIEKPGYFQRTLSYSYTPVGLESADPSVMELANITSIQFLVDYAQVTGNHFIHNLAHTLLVLPSGYAANTAWTDTHDLASAFWVQDPVPISLSAALWMIFNLLFIAAGIYSMWVRSRWQALLPVLFFSVYNLSSALGGFSGQRFILPVDWVGYFYFFSGAAWLCSATLQAASWQMPAWLSRPSNWPEKAPDRSIRAYGLHLSAATLLLLSAGMLYPLIEAATPLKYGPVNQAELVPILTDLAQTWLTDEQLPRFYQLMARPDLEILYGVALYPRQMDNVTSSVGVTSPDEEIDYPYLSYTFEGQIQITVLQPTSGNPLELPHDAEVLVAGWRYKNRFHAFATALPVEGRMYFSSPNEK